MSKSMFANPKAALGFAGVTIAIGVAASFAASAFLPQAAVEPEVVAQPEAEAAKPAPAQPAPQTAWADDGYADDWNASSVDTASAFGSGAAGPMPSEQPEFGDYSGSGAQEDMRSEARGGSATQRSRQGDGPRIQSGAAANAPPLERSGGNESASLERVE
ncbi:hypothetical protein [Qipengyuania sp. ASV99]|uniref:hypothetical protein n=1 Tax=Qipengyuania sp. ASV99 TaxID=3399681 RepID=UPI003A4C7EED